MPFTDSIKMVDVVIAEKTTLNAAPADVLAGKQFIGASHTVETGTLPTLPQKTDMEIGAGETYTVDNGYNPASYNIKAKDIPEQTPGTATAGDIVSTKTAWVNGVKLTGTMTDNGASSSLLLCGQSYTIPKGYHNGSGVVEAKSLASQTAGNATTEKIITGITCWSNGIQIAGSMVDNGSVSATLLAGETYTIPIGYHTGMGTVTAQDLYSQTRADATAIEIVQGKTAWVNGTKVTGTMTNNAESTVMLPLNGTYSIPNGYHTGFGKVTQNIPSKEGETIAPKKESQTLETAGYYMTGDIIISGVDALNYNYDSAIMKDLSGNIISNYALTVTDNNTATVYLYMDTWHNGSSKNIYLLSSTNLVEASTSTARSIVLSEFIDKGVSTSTTIDSITISFGFDESQEAQYIKFTGIASGNITLTSVLCTKEFGV